MNAITLLLVAMTLAATSLGWAQTSVTKDFLPPPPAGKDWKLVWQDEFDGEKLDTTKWTPRPDGKRKGGWWSQKAVGLDGKGNLVIKTFMDGDKPTDGCITTQGKFEHSFGYYVARVQFQSQPGHWSAFWITGPGVGKVGDGARDGCEIDIMDTVTPVVQQNTSSPSQASRIDHRG